MKIKIRSKPMKEARKKKLPQVVHGIPMGDSYPPHLLCGTQFQYLDITTSKPKTITCPKCLVAMDEGLENGSLLLNKTNNLVKADNYKEEVFVVYTESRVSVEAPDEEPGPWDWRGTDDLNAKFDYVSIEQPSNPLHELAHANFPIEAGDKVFVAWLNFTDGDTFGQTRGQFESKGVFKTRKEAEASLKGAQQEYSGYFSELESVHVEETIVR